MSNEIRAGRGIAVHSVNGGVVISCTGNGNVAKSGNQAESGTDPVEMYGQDDLAAVTYTTWERSPMTPATEPVKVKMLTRTKYSKDDDKNYNYYMILTFSTRGALLKVEGETREDAFETTLHEHS